MTKPSWNSDSKFPISKSERKKSSMSENDIFQNKSSRMESMSKALGFDIPVELITLPSQGKLYPSDHPFHDAEGVEVRSMTAREEDLLTSTALHKSGQVINKLVESCLCNKSVNVDTLLTGDRDAILIALRVIGYGAAYKVKLSCPECDASFTHSFELNKLHIKGLGAEPVSPGVNRFAFQLPLSKAAVDFKLLTCGEEKEMNVQSEQKKKNSAQPESKITTRLFHSILSINGQEDRGKIATISSNLRAGDSRSLRNYISKVEPAIDMTQDVQCASCGTVSEVDVPLTANFFWPDDD
jgi:hypothetical protein